MTMTNHGHIAVNHQFRMHLARLTTLTQITAGLIGGLALIAVIAAPDYWLVVAHLTITAGLFGYAGWTRRSNYVNEEFMLLALSVISDADERGRLIEANTQLVESIIATVKTRAAWAVGVSLIGGITIASGYAIDLATG